MTKPSELDLLKGACDFNSGTLAEIYDGYNQGIYRYAMRLLGDDALAEDCVAETFSRFLKALRNGAGPSKHLQAYLYRIAHNWVTDHYRRNEPSQLDLDETENIGSAFRTDIHVEDQLERDQVRLALRALTPDQRAVITLRFLEGLENEEVAEVIQKPVNAVKALQHRGLKMLRRILVQEFEELEGGVYDPTS